MPRGTAKPEPAVSAVLATAFALGTWLTAAWLIQPLCFASSDFYAFWAAARLAHQTIYDPAAEEAIQRAECPEVRGKRFIRPAPEALLLYPLGRLPFRTAYVAWSLLNAAACLAFLRLRGSRPPEILASALYLPLIWSFGLGQDAALLLLAFGAGTHFLGQGRMCTGGALLALCLLKPNIFFAAPLVLVLRKQRAALAGMCLTAAGMYAVAALACGPEWPGRFIAAVLENEGAIAPNIVGLPGLVPHTATGIRLRMAMAPLGAALTLAWSRRQSLQAALCSAVAAGLVFGPRAMIYDGVFLLPVLLNRLATGETIAAGLALGLVVTPVRQFVQVTSPVWIWLATSKRRGRDGGVQPC